MEGRPSMAMISNDFSTSVEVLEGAGGSSGSIAPLPGKSSTAHLSVEKSGEGGSLSSVTGRNEEDARDGHVPFALPGDI